MRVAVRGWLIRGLILAGIAGLVALGWVANSWVSPERVRESVIAHLNEQFDGVDVHLGSARMRILGGIAVTDLKLTRRGDPPDKPFLVVPAAVLYHDKEQLNRGRLVIRKVELENPEVRLERDADGTWNLARVLRPSAPDRPIPTFVAKGATLTVLDRKPGGLPPLTFTDARFELLNDPLPVLTLHARANARGYGPVQLRTQLNRVTNQLGVGLTLPEFPLGASAAAAAERFAPALAPHLAKLSATAAVTADLTYTPDTVPAWRHDVRVEVKDARFDHPDLPGPVEQLAVKVRSVDGRVKVEEATARLAGAHVKIAALETRSDAAARDARSPTADDPFTPLEDHLQKLDLTVSGIKLDDGLFDRFGDRGRKARRVFSPTGAVDVGYKFTRDAAGWKREVEVRPRGVAGHYEKFAYPVSEVEGTVKRTVTHAGDDGTAVQLRGKTAGQDVTITGRLAGLGERDPLVHLRIAGNNIPLDEALISALPGRYAGLVRQFRATGKGNFRIEIDQPRGTNQFENKFEIDIRDAALNFTGFPYPVEKVQGKLVVRTTASDPDRPIRPGEGPAPADRDELVLHEFTAVHGSSLFRVYGSKRGVPGTPDRKLLLHVEANACALDQDLRNATATLKLDGVWATFAPRGVLTFTADAEMLDRGPPPGRPDLDPPFDPAADLKLTFNFYGPTVTPAFFPYEVTDLSGRVEYAAGRVGLDYLAGRHGETRLKLEAGEVRFYPDGTVWANLGKTEVKPFVADAALLQALPGKLRSGMEELKLRGGAELTVKHLVVLTPPDPPRHAIPPPEPLPIGPLTAAPVAPLPYALVARSQSPAAPHPPPRPDPTVYWDFEVKLAGAALDAGLTWDELYGVLACRGRYEGTHLGPVRGNAWLDRAVVAGQPVTGAKFHARTPPQQPDPQRPGQFLPIGVEFTDLSGDLFHGVLGGEARVVLADPVQYVVWLSAADVQLEGVAQHYNLGKESDLKGVAQARVKLYNRPDPRTGKWVTEGAGQIDVPTGRMYNLPVLLDLVKVMKGQAPDKTAFEEAHATFRVQGDRIRVDQLDLIGKAVCLGGTGELDTSGQYVKFEFYTLGSQILAHLVNTPVGDLSAFLSRNFFMKIKLTRENGQLKYRAEPVPVVTEPAKAAVDRLKRLMGR